MFQLSIWILFDTQIRITQAELEKKEKKSIVTQIYFVFLM